MKTIIYIILYSLINILVIFTDMTYELNGFMLITFYILSIFFLHKYKSVESKNDKTSDFHSNKTSIIISVIVVTCAFYVLYNILLILWLKEDFNIVDFRIYSLLDLFKIVIIYPVLEEAIYRGYFLKFSNQRISSIKSIVIVSVIFTLTHIFTDSGLLYIFIISIFISYIFFKFKSLLICIFIHSLFNILAVFFTEHLYSASHKYSNWLIFTSIIFITISMYNLNTQSKNEQN